MNAKHRVSLHTTAEERRIGSLREFFGSLQGRAALLGLLGAIVLVIGGLGSGSLRRHDALLENMQLGWLRYGHGMVISSILLWTGVLVMIWAWVRLGRLTLRGGVTLAGLRLTVLMWTVPLLLSVPLFSRDAYSYIAQGALLRDGFNPYKVGPVANPGVILDNVSTVWTTTPAPYGPAFMLTAKTVTMIAGDNVVAGTLLMRVAMLPGLLLTLWAVPRLARYLGGNPAVAIWLAVLNPLVLIHLIGGVHNEVLMVGLMTAGLVLALQRHHAAGIAVVTVGLAVKATAGVALPFIVWIWMVHLREDATESGTTPAHPLVLFARTAIPGVAVFAIVLAAISFAAQLGLGWLTALQGSALIVNWLSLPTILAHIVTWFTSFPLLSVLDITRMICGAAMLIILITVWWRGRHTQRDAVLGLLLALLAIVVLSPAALPWYYSWPIAIAAGFALSDRSLVILTGLSVWLMVIFRPDGAHGMYDLVHVALTFAAAFIAARSLTVEDPLRLRQLVRGKPKQATGPSAQAPTA